MNTPTKTSTRWKQLGTTAEVDAQGVMHTSFHFMELNSGEDLTVSVSGHAKADVGYFIGVLEAVAATFRNAAGLPQPEHTTLVPSTKAH